MTDIRPLDPADLPGVDRLLRDHLPYWPSSDAGKRFLAATLLDHPWADRELPSLVAVAGEGEVAGFIGAQVRRMSMGERTLRGVCCSHFVVASEHRGSAAGVSLLRRLLSGDQDVTWSDTAIDPVVRLWEVFGGYLDASRHDDWMLALRPRRWLQDIAVSGLRERHLSRDSVPVAALPFQAAGPRLLGRAFPPLATGVAGGNATAAAIVEATREIDRKGRLRIAYDEDFLAHLFGQIETSRWPLVRRLVHREGQPIGWYAYVGGRFGVCRVLQFCSFGADGDDVLGELCNHARASGATLLSGRVEPHMVEPLRNRFAALGFARRPVVHARDPELRATFLTSSSLISQLDGEWFVN